MDLTDILKEKYRLLYIKAMDEADGKMPKKSAIRILDIVVDEMIDKAIKNILEEDPNFDKKEIKKTKSELRSALKKYKKELLKKDIPVTR